MKRVMINLLAQPGFLGTHASLVSDLSLILICITAILFTVGFIVGRKKHFQAHRWIQTTAACINALVVLLVMIRSFYVSILPGLPGRLLEGSYGVTTFHAIVGAIGLCLGLFVMIKANVLIPGNRDFANFKRFMQVSFGMYMLATFIGILVYIEAFVLGI
jgi:uncharacterized membrane protein YozB (DUF420 family)